MAYQRNNIPLFAGDTPMGVTYHESNARMSQVAVHNGTVYLAGQVPADATVGMLSLIHI